MNHIFLSTVATAAIGLFSAKAGDLLRGAPPYGRKPCQATHVSGVVWKYQAETAQRRAAWLPVQRHETC